MTEQDSFYARLSLQHHLNPLHIYTKLKNTGVEEKEAMAMAREYELAIQKTRIYILLNNE